MRGMSALLVACTIVASVALPLGLPAVALADSLAMGPMVAITGRVESRPLESPVGEWVVDGTAFQVVESTRLIEAAGPAEVGAQVAVLARRMADGPLQAFVIRVQSPAQAAWLQSLLAQVRQALGLTARLRLRVQSQEQLQTQTRLQTQEQTQTRQQDQTQAQTQTQSHTQLQEQTETRQQDQTQTQQQTRTQTRSMLGR